MEDAELSKIQYIIQRYHIITVHWNVVFGIVTLTLRNWLMFEAKQTDVKKHVALNMYWYFMTYNMKPSYVY